jgi:signal transduction histidine kinase
MDLIKNSEDINKEEIISIIGKIDRSANRMNKLISDLLKYAEIENRLIKISKVDLNSLFKNISEDTNSSQYLRCDGLPKIDGDETQIYQLFKNIIENALKFTRPGCSPEIVVYARPMPGFSKFAEIMISDNGIGIEKENFDKIFNAFSRVSNNYQGTGIGLATCKRIVSNHKGKISLKSKFGEGTTFIVTLPINQF